MNEDYDGLWYRTEHGQTLGRLGLEGGYILADEELGDPEEPEDADARVTLEQGRVDHPGFFVTAQLYGGWFYVTAHRETREDGEEVYEALRRELESLVLLLPFENDRDVTEKAAKLTAAAQELEARYS